jgi:hypothetical protein
MMEMMMMMMMMMICGTGWYHTTCMGISDTVSLFSSHEHDFVCPKCDNLVPDYSPLSMTNHVKNLKAKFCSVSQK